MVVKSKRTAIFWNANAPVNILFPTLISVARMASPALMTDTPRQLIAQDEARRVIKRTDLSVVVAKGKVACYPVSFRVQFFLGAL